jgi:two-component system sensor histidine kinase/response regulator
MDSKIKSDDLTVLVVDDNQENLKVVSNILRSEGYKLALAMGGREALKILKEIKVDLILLDIMMPDMNGYEVCSRIKSNADWRMIPVIFLTAKNQMDDLIKSFEVGGVDYLTKPSHREELLVRVKTHLELKVSREKILEMIHNRDKLYSRIAHDIRSPLSGINQTLDAVNQGYIEVGSKDFSEIISDLSNTTKNTFNMLNSLLEWTREQIDDHVEFTMKPVNVHSLLSDCISLESMNSKIKGVSIRQYTKQTDVAVCDEATIHSVFRNLLSNAIKFTSSGGMIEISSSKDNDELNIMIKDTGVGMSEETIGKIFEKGETVSTSGTNKEQGTGLGLFIVKDFIEKNRGQISVKSQPGKGTTFAVTLQTDINDG